MKKKILKMKKKEKIKIWIIKKRKIKLENKKEEIDNKKDDDNKEEKDKENSENEENKKKILNLEKKIEDYCKEKKLLNKEISGITGEGINKLFEELIIISYNDIQNFEIGNKEFDV